jgi:hypothetical protein
MLFALGLAASAAVTACGSSPETGPAPVAQSHSLQLVLKGHPEFFVGSYDPGSKTAVFSEASDTERVLTAGVMLGARRVGTISTTSLRVAIPEDVGPGTTLSIAPDQPGSRPFDVVVADSSEGTTKTLNVLGCGNQGGTSMCVDWEVFFIWVHCAESRCCVLGVGCL